MPQIAMKQLFLPVALLALSVSANADPITVNPTEATSSVSTSINSSWCLPTAPCTLDWAYAPTLEAASEQLGLGESWTFDFFELIVGGKGVVPDATIEATLGFSEPEMTASANGKGGYFTIYGLFSGGFLHWNQPDWIELDDGSFLSVTFENVLALGHDDSRMVRATVSRYTQVSEPGTLLLFGLGLLAMASMRRRFQR